MYDNVIYYTHQQNGAEHSTEDNFAIVLRENEDGSKDLVVFPPGGPTKYVNAKEYNPDEDFAAGGSYYRTDGDAPDFSGFDYADNIEWSHMIQRHTGERAAITRAADVEPTRERHREERDALRAKLDQKYKPGDAPADQNPEDDNEAA